jgi:hypothetical protein
VFQADYDAAVAAVREALGEKETHYRASPSEARRTSTVGK